MSILILASHLLLNFPSGLLTPGCAAVNLIVFYFSAIYVTSPARHFPDFITQMVFGEEYKSQSHFTSSFLVPDIFFSTLFSHRCSLYPSSNVRNRVPHPSITKEKLLPCTFIYSILYSFKQDSGRQKTLKWMLTCVIWMEVALNFLKSAIWFISAFPPDILNLLHFQRVYHE